MARITLGQQIKDLEKNLHTANLEALAQKQTVAKLSEANKKNIQRIDGCKATLAVKNQLIEDLRKDNNERKAAYDLAAGSRNKRKEALEGLAAQLKNRDADVAILNTSIAEALAAVEIGLYTFYPEALEGNTGVKLKPKARLLLRVFDILEKGRLAAVQNDFNL